MTGTMRVVECGPARADAGELRMPVQEAFPQERVADAHRALAQRHGRGTRVLLVGAAAEQGGDSKTPGRAA